uniref:Putative secreted protein n=1 Tax=Anopheles darlingi TaxID=43151 RepID=A0A2M4DPI6_ANODA
MPRALRFLTGVFVLQSESEPSASARRRLFYCCQGWRWRKTHINQKRAGQSGSEESGGGVSPALINESSPFSKRAPHTDAPISAVFLDQI